MGNSEYADNIIIACDGSEQALNAFTDALEVVKNRNLPKPEIQAVAVAQPPEPANIVELDAVIDNATQQYQQQIGELQAKAMNLDIVTEVAVGHPAEQVIQNATDHSIDTIFVGQARKSRIEAWLLGLVSKRIAAYAHCAVTIVK